MQLKILTCLNDVEWHGQNALSSSHSLGYPLLLQAILAFLDHVTRQQQILPDVIQEYQQLLVGDLHVSEPIYLTT